MKLIFLAAALATISIPATAGQITVNLSDEDQQGFQNLPGAVDACVAGLTLRGDPAMCKAIAQFAIQIGAKVTSAKPSPNTEPEKNPAK